MLFKLAIKNIKKSIKDYSIYFFTLVVAISIFYIFNSLESQQSMLALNDSKHQIIQSIVYVLGYISIFISIVLGFLIIYSNNFLIKRRKKEFGLYLTLGMSKRKVSLILVIETLIVGLISLGVGLVVGVFLSQFLSIITAKLFEVDMLSYKFIFSSEAMYKSIIYFGIIFILVMVFNVINISKNKLIDLLTAEKKNEKVRFRNKYIMIISFVLSVCFIGYAYKLLFDGALVSMDRNFIIMILCGSIGTLLLFFSISGFFLKIFEHIKKIYFKGLNMFVLKQVNNKFNTTVFSTTIICLMLLLTIGILSGSLSLISVYNNSLMQTNITDFTIEGFESNCIVIDENKCEYVNIDSTLVKEITKESYFDKYVKEYAYYELYETDTLSLLSMVDDVTLKEIKKQYGDSLGLDSAIHIMSESDYNKILKLYGKDEVVDLKEGEYILTVGLDKALEFFDGFYKSKGTININGKELKPITSEIIRINYRNYSSDSNFGTVIVDDKIINNLELYSSDIIGNYIKTKDVSKLEKEFIKEVSSREGTFTYITKLDMQETNITIKTMIIFVGLYLGITFAISSATILAIGELSSASDNKERYKILRKIGSDDKLLNKALFSQISISFILPLVIALFHSYFGLKQLNGIIEVVGHIDLSSNIFITTIFIVIVYGGYFIATYLSSKRITRGE